MTSNAKYAVLPPKIPCPSISSSYAEYVPSSAIGSQAQLKPRAGNTHQRTSSELFLEEQPSWLDELLDEPETPVRKGGHRRSSSDSFAYVDASGFGTMNYAAQDNKTLSNVTPLSSWGSQDFVVHKELQNSTFYANPNPSGNIKNNKPWDASVSSVPSPWSLPSAKNHTIVSTAGSMNMSQDADRNTASLAERRGPVDPDPQEPKGYLEKKDLTLLKSSVSEADTKHAKQKFAQRSRVRKLQYISTLERNIQALAAEGSEVSAECEFLNQQNIILGMENKALQQRLEGLSQEQLIKHLEHEILEREVGRLRTLYQQQQIQQQQQQMTAGHQRTKSRDLDQQFANLSMKHKEASANCP